jgi:hypothetical protein
MTKPIIKHPKPRVLFICKQRPARYGASYGLLNSCRFLCNALHSMDIEAKLVEVIDNNYIDREVHKYKPTHVFIEALWVVPEKFDVLIPLHPDVHWNVRLHSNTPFLANEGMAMEWIVKYDDLQRKYFQFHITPNATQMANDLKKSLNIDTLYAPNVYQPDVATPPLSPPPPADKNTKVMDIGCFGAVRPMKNQLIQAMAAMAFADEIRKPLRFHVNHSRLEQNGENAYKNMVALFKGTQHTLVSHEWMSHEDFIALIKRMDLGLQVSFSETFNIVAADFVHNGVPIVGSDEIEWMSPLYKANPTDLNNIVSHLWSAWLGRVINLHKVNNWGLEEYNKGARKVWKKMLKIN